MPEKCSKCYLRYHCDEHTEFICKSNYYCKYINDGGRKHGYLIATYECSVCGEHYAEPVSECSSCKAIMWPKKQIKDTFDRE